MGEKGAESIAAGIAGPVLGFMEPGAVAAAMRAAEQGSPVPEATGPAGELGAEFDATSALGGSSGVAGVLSGVAPNPMGHTASA